jgi:transposase InsO family protein
LAPSVLADRPPRFTSRDFRRHLSKNGIELIHAIANDVFFGPLYDYVE